MLSLAGGGVVIGFVGAVLTVPPLVGAAADVDVGAGVDDVVGAVLVAVRLGVPASDPPHAARAPTKAAAARAVPQRCSLMREP